MISNFELHPGAQPLSSLAGLLAVLADASRAPAAPGQPWHCPVPTLEGQPRVPPALRTPAPSQGTAPATGHSLPPEVGLDGRAANRPAAKDGDYLLRLYLRDALREPLLTPEEESEMVWRASFDDEPARERLVLGNLRLVVHIGLEYRGLGLPLSDLINEGNLGLMRAAELFVPTYGGRFARYAATWIRQRMRRALSYQAWPMRMPADFSWQQNQVRAAEGRLGAEAANEEVAAECGLRLATVRRLRASGHPRCLSLQSPVSDDEEGQVLADTLPDPEATPPDEALARSTAREFVEGLLLLLRPREQQVLRLRFGLDDGRQRTLEEVGDALGYVRQGIHRIESGALSKLRRHLAGAFHGNAL
jgi:RNA polymerase primary sigma factor